MTMTATTQPLNLKREHVALMMMAVGFTCPATTGAATRACNSAEQYRVIQDCMRVVLFQISFLVCCCTSYQLFAPTSICFTGGLSCIFRMSIPPASYSGSTSFGISSTPMFLLTLTRATSAVFVALLSLKWLSAFDAKFNHVFHYSIENEQKGDVFRVPPSRTLVEQKNQQQGEVALWPRRQIFNLLHYNWKKFVRLCQLPRLVGHRIERCGSKFSLIDLEGVNPNKAEASATTHRERLSERTPRLGGAIVCSHGNKNHEKSAEMTDSLLSYCSVTS